MMPTRYYAIDVYNADAPHQEQRRDIDEAISASRGDSDATDMPLMRLTPPELPCAVVFSPPMPLFSRRRYARLLCLLFTVDDAKNERCAPPDILRVIVSRHMASCVYVVHGSRAAPRQRRDGIPYYAIFSRQPTLRSVEDMAR